MYLGRIDEELGFDFWVGVVEEGWVSMLVDKLADVLLFIELPSELDVDVAGMVFSEGLVRGFILPVDWDRCIAASAVACKSIK